MAHSQAVASESPYHGASIEHRLLQQGEKLQSILSESQQLLNQSVRISLEDVIRKTIINNPQIAQSIALVQAKKSEVAAEKRKWNPTLKFSEHLKTQSLASNCLH